MTKTCSKCGEEKSLDEFYQNPRSLYRRADCRACVRKYKSAHRATVTDTKRCSVVGCEKEYNKNRGRMCPMHEARTHKWGDPNSTGSHRPRGDSTLRDALGRKECFRCKQWLLEAEYHFNKSTGDTLATECKICAVAGQQRMTRNDIDILLKNQNNACAICSEPFEGKFAIDHDHSCCPGKNLRKGKTCGKCVRGLLCRGCNHGLGNFRDRPDILLEAVAYLEKSSKSS